MLQIEKGQDIKQELLHRYKTILPDELIKIWEDNGLARLMGEYLKAVNPEDYQELLKETYFRGNISIPILVTAFGDIVTFEEGQYIGMVKYKMVISSCSQKILNVLYKTLEMTIFRKVFSDTPVYRSSK